MGSTIFASLRRAGSVAIAFLLFSACGGGGGGGNSTPPPPPPPPPPPAQISAVTINGTASNGASYRARVLEIGVHDLAWDSARQVLYASVTAGSAVRPRSITAFNPANLDIGTSRPLNNAAAVLRRTEDGQFLYAGINAEGLVQRFTLPDLQPDVALTLGNSSVNPQTLLSGNDFAPMPGQPRTLAVARRDAASHPVMRDVVIFDDTVARPTVASGFAIWGLAWKADGTGLWGFTNETASGLIFTMGVDQGGVSVTGGISEGLREGSSFLYLVDGRVYASNGEVLEAANLDRAGVYVTPFGCLFAKPQSGAELIFALCGSEQDPAGSLDVRAYELDTFRPVATVRIPNLRLNVNGFLTSIVHWGTNGLAFAVPGDEVVLIDGDFLTSTTPTAVPAPVVQTVTANGTSETGAAYRLRVIPIAAYDVATDPVRDVLYLSVPGASPYAPNTVAVVDPQTGAFTGAVPVGSEPNTLAISPDAQILYVGVDGASSVRRLRLDILASDAVLTLGREPNIAPYYAREILVAPGAPGTVAVTRSHPLDSITTPGDGVVVFDGSVQRPLIGANHWTLPNSYANGPHTTTFQWGADAQTLYGTDTQTSASLYSIFSVDAGGVTFVSSTGILGSPFLFDGGQLYDHGGRVLDPANGATVGQVDFSQFPIGGLGSLSGMRVLIDADGATLYYAGWQGQASEPTFRLFVVDRGTLTAQDMITYRPTPAQALQPPDVWQIVKWSDSGVAFLSANGQLVLVDGPAVSGP